MRVLTQSTFLMDDGLSNNNKILKFIPFLIIFNDKCGAYTMSVVYIFGPRPSSASEGLHSVT